MLLFPYKSSPYLAFDRKRLVPFTPTVETHLLHLKSKQEEMKRLFGNSYSNKDDFVCTWDDGKLVLPDYLSAKFKKDLKKF